MKSTIAEGTFNDLITTRSKPGYEYSEIKEPIHLAVDGNTVDIRYEGAYVTSAVLREPYGVQHQIFYCSDEIRDAKLRAGHIMGPKEGPIGVDPAELGSEHQHGRGRWLDWRVVKSEESEPGAASEWRSVYLEADQPAGCVGLSRSIKLDSHYGLTVASSMVNNTGNVQSGTRIGDHFYFICPGSDLSEVDIISPKRQLEFTDPSLLEQIAGTGYFFEDFNGDAIVQFPGLKLAIHSSVAMKNKDVSARSDMGPLAMRIWRPEGAPFICLEPQVGYTAEGTDTLEGGFPLAVGSTATLQTTLRLLA